MKTLWILSLVLPLVVSPGFAADGKLIAKAEKVIKSLAGKDVELVHREYEIPGDVKASIRQAVQQDFYRETVGLWEIRRENGTQAYAVMDDVLGKHMPITFVVLFDTSGVITACRVIKYRERYGSGVKSKRWLRQFTKKTAASGFHVGQDIDAISGATISSNSVTKGIEKLAKLFQHIIE
jgi:Na+-translocating ferredoxin:NAD+ oxidoreductase RnfG subunit